MKTETERMAEDRGESLLESGFKEWLATGDYLKSGNMNQALRLAFLAGVTFGLKQLEAQVQEFVNQGAAKQ